MTSKLSAQTVTECTVYDVLKSPAERLQFHTFKDYIFNGGKLHIEQTSSELWGKSAPVL